MSRVFMIRAGLGALIVLIAIGIFLSFPTLLALNVEYTQEKTFAEMHRQFPVTVNPKEKLIVESDLVNEFLDNHGSVLQATVWNIGDVLGKIFSFIAIAIADAPLYQNLASADGRFVNITPGMRKEQVADAFANVLSWDVKQKKAFLTASPYSSLPLLEGSFSPGIYLIKNDTSPLGVQTAVNERFSQEILSRYGTTTAQLVPINQALTIASLIEREAGGQDDRRIISGIIWNRLFIDMKLQIDATLQYSRANTTATKNWWPKPVPNDRFIKSPYNTYMHKGLPPAPIANPSVASVLAALNPKNTLCLFYFHDASGGFHCTETYVEHVALLNKYYGRGK